MSLSSHRAVMLTAQCNNKYFYPEEEEEQLIKKAQASLNSEIFL
jgi:hypothetical protein